MGGRIEEYALIGDTRTAALVHADGTVDWLCLPRFDSPAVFAGLLGTEDHGFWRLGPAHGPGETPPVAARRRYRGESLVLESEWDTADGTVRVVDFMPPAEPARDTAPRLVRVVEGVAGRVAMRAGLRMRFSYGRVVPWVRQARGRLVAVAGPDSIWLDGDADTFGRDLTTYADFTVGPGERVAFTLSWQPSHHEPPPLPAPADALAATELYWRDWAAGCTYIGPYRDAVLRSLVTLKALTYGPTGGIVAAPTTSLPELIGGVRDRDHRFTRLRDASATLTSLLRTGYRDEAAAWREWLLRAVAGDPDNLQVSYGIAGERVLRARQFQLDVYGEVVDALHVAQMTGLAGNGHASRLQMRLIHYLERHWDQPDEGIWQLPGPRRHFTHSKVMAWVAVDRAVKLLERTPLTGPVERWRGLRERIHRDVCEQGYDAERNTFTQSYGSGELDASLLLLPQTGFLPPDDKRVVGTVEAVRRELSTADGLVLRASDDESRDVAFLACSFWLSDALATIGRVDEARRLFEKLLALRTDLGLLAEEWDTRRRRQTGNFPQALSHVALVGTALRLTAARS